MRKFSIALFGLALFSPIAAEAQCFNRFACTDPSVVEIRSQISVNVPVPAQASATDMMKAMEDSRRDLYAMSNRECDTLKSIFGGECTLSQVNINSAIQDRGMGKNAYVSISNTYQLKKPTK